MFEMLPLAAADVELYIQWPASYVHCWRDVCDIALLLECWTSLKKTMSPHDSFLLDHLQNDEWDLPSSAALSRDVEQLQHPRETSI